jgi:uncharacterized protein (DUF736 family)
MAYDKPYEEKPNTGTFFANKTKTNPKAPDYRGTVTLNLNDYEIHGNVVKVELAGWKQTAKSGLTYLQIKAQKPREQQAQQQQPKTEELDDEIEF